MEDKTDINLSYVEYNTCVMAVTKCDILWRALKAGLPVTLTKEGFGFPDLTYDEESDLIQKLVNNAELAWLKEQREKEPKSEREVTDFTKFKKKKTNSRHSKRRRRTSQFEEEANV